MSKMSDIMIDIETLYYSGMSPYDIAKYLQVPLEWIETVIHGSYLDDGYDDSMDGDHESGLASAGFGTDEDYGGVEDDVF